MNEFDISKSRGRNKQNKQVRKSKGAQSKSQTFSHSKRAKNAKKGHSNALRQERKEYMDRELDQKDSKYMCQKNKARYKRKW